MWFWNKVEIYCGYSFKDFTELRDALASKGIRYDYKTIINNGRKTRHSIFPLNKEHTTLYYLYVHHKDYDQAMYLTSNRKRSGMHAGL